LQGQRDIPLNENGKLQALRCGMALKDGNWKAVFTSPLMRAKQTADIVAKCLGLQEIYKDSGLMERYYGKATGLTEEERKEIFPDDKYEGIEKWEELRDRVYGAVIKSADRFYPENIIIISHGSAINSILAELSNREIGTGKTLLKNACISMLTYKDSVLTISFYNKLCDEVFL
jgi:uncharacterized phosphatase